MLRIEMVIDLRRRLEDIYQRYGFETAKVYENEKVIVFTLKTGYFDNADIVPLAPDADTKKPFDDFSGLNYACTVREYLNPKQTETELFKGFFSVSLIMERLAKDYAKFTNSIVRQYADDAKYTYINAPYTVNGKVGLTSPANEVVARLGDSRPILFLIEAAAGFGKTCTAFEIVNQLVQGETYLPLFSELSRNRKAPIFRYVLLDEIDRRFPTLSSRLVQSEMINGRVVAILDGFDELLRKSDDVDEFENQEPMLETIGQFLTGQAKIVLTTRRTVLFEGDAFHAWAYDHANEFELVRIRIGEPSLIDWLPEGRLKAIQSTSLDIKNSLANPVLLSYLRCIPQDKFDAVIESPQGLVDRYFNFLLERERTRQDLQMSVDTQKSILTTITNDMINNGYTSEQREYIVELVLKNCVQEIEEALSLYPTTEKPDREYLANKIASHALLDRSTKEENKIGFINEFVLGYFVARNILLSKNWLNDDIRFLEPAVTAYRPRSLDDRQQLLERIHDSLEFTAVSYRSDFTAQLIGEINFPLVSDEAEGLEFDGVVIGMSKIENFQFNDCVFRGCTIVLDNMSNATFLNCKFYENNTAVGSPAGSVYVLGDIGDSEFLKSAIQLAVTTSSPDQLPDREKLIEKHVLEKFWPVGREKLLHKHRPISGICTGHGEFRPDDVYEAIIRLKKDGLLLQPNNASFVELNFERLADIRVILGRVQ
jgi:hypothetical protein